MFAETWFAERVLAFIPLLLSLTVHEWAHAWAAYRLGDDTARHLGRMTLDPLAHIDPVGTLVLPLLGVPFGWAKPVPVNPLRFTVDTRVGMMVTAAAGPISNVVLALLCAVGLAIGGTVLPNLFGPGDPLRALAANAVLLNLVLAFFNLVPLPPLDGSRIADWLMPDALRPTWDRLQGTSWAFIAFLLVVPMLLGIDLFVWPRALAGMLVG